MIVKSASCDPKLRYEGTGKIAKINLAETNKAAKERIIYLRETIIQIMIKAIFNKTATTKNAGNKAAIREVSGEG